MKIKPWKNTFLRPNAPKPPLSGRKNNMKVINANSIMKFVERYEELAAVKKRELNITLYINAPMLRYAMEKFPVREVEIVQHGRWIPTRPNVSSVKCSICEKFWETETPRCPSCGAKMDLEE